MWSFDDSFRILVPASAERVWALVSSLDNVPQWDPNTLASKRLPGGVTWELKFRRWESFFYTVATSTPLRYVRFASTNASRTIVTSETFSINPLASGSSLTYTFSMHVSEWRALFAWRYKKDLELELSEMRARLLALLAN